MQSQFDFSKHFGRFLNDRHKSREYFIVIDNTEWPQALSDKNWLHPKPYQENDEMTIFIEMNITSTFTSTHRHGAFVALFSVVIISEIVVFMIAGVVYVHM